MTTLADLAARYPKLLATLEEYDYFPGQLQSDFARILDALEGVWGTPQAGTTYKYEKIDGNFTKNANGEETFPLVVWTDSAFKVSGGCNSNGFDFVSPITVSGTGSFSLPAVNLFTSAKHFEAVFFKDNLATVYNHDYSTRKLNTGICNFVTRSTTPQTLSITTWGPLGFANTVENCEGSFSGTLYENDQSEMNCANSSAHPYSGTFKYYTK